MSERDATGEAGGDAGAGAAGVDRRQVALVVLCLLGLVVAAFVAPILPQSGGLGDAGGGSGSNGGSGGSSGQSGDGGGSSDGSGGGSGGAGQTVGEGSGSGDGNGAGGDANGEGNGANGDGEGDSGGEGDVIRDEGDPIPIPGGDEPPTERGCGVVVENEPIPGGTVEVSVYDDLKPAAAVPVWFGDRFVGRTDETGSVSGRAPYTREMNVTVEMPGADCEFYRRQYEDEAQSDVDPSGRASPLRSGFDPLDASPLALGGGAAGGESVAAQSTQATDGANDSSPYAVHGSVNVTVGGEPYPGETVLVLATVEHVPMRRASVSVDGERVGRTTANGTYELTVPRDQERVTVTVERGDFAGSTTVDVWLLDARVVPQEGLPFPGEPALVNATVGGPPVTDARVSLDGSRLGRTDEHGSLGLALPADPRQSVTVRTERQRASTSLWSAYLATITPSAFLLLVGIVGVPVTARTRGRGAARRAALVWTAVATMFVGLVVGEAFGLLVSTGVVLLGAALSNRQRVQSGGSSLAESLRALVAFVRRSALAVADWIAVALDRVRAALGRLAARVAALPLSVRGLAARLWGWIRRLPGRVRSFAAARLTVRRAVAAVVAVAVVAGLTWRFGALGLLGSLVALFVVFLAYRRWAREESDGEASGDGDAGPTFGRGSRPASGDDSRARRSLRAIWRQFARWVRPNSWRQSTPGEVSRAAVERGFPERPVRVLTEAFREAEYGDRPSTDRSERAREAFESIEREREGEDS
ncbi:DUF4129 domain-containing protein [Halosimplex aquaticum]|uniref:DUF4129 domain-containing protein n=1 Tax=Halosimplex aquaticum TaxID=3026162 RepID=A0ABD5Y3H5_9EURY|nr:DUF4129 domain-containing protein [Halosimplex aquaticum]